jgi:hypothetical protein
MVLWQNVSIGIRRQHGHRQRQDQPGSDRRCEHLSLVLCWNPLRGVVAFVRTTLIGAAFGFTRARNTFIASKTEHSYPIVQTPKFLDGVIPRDVNGFAMQDVDGPPGKYKLVVWCQAKYTAEHTVEGWRSKIELFSVEANGHATEIWQSEDEELYEPRISVVPEWKCHGQQVFLVRRQAGAAAELVDPVWVQNGVVHKLPEVLADYFEIKQLPSDAPKTQLIGYSRFPESFEVPKLYEWNGEGFVVNEIKLQNLSKFRG